jgi:hypothetical protein
VAEVEALDALHLSEAALEGLRKVIADACSASMFARRFLRIVVGVRAADGDVTLSHRAT